MMGSGFIEGRRQASAHLGRVLVLGLGVTGRAVLAYLEPLVGGRVDEIVVAERDDAPIEGSFDLCVASPGISQLSDFYRRAQAASAQIVSEVEFAWRESRTRDRWVAVTGTNGKTTTTALTAALLAAAGAQASCVGNIGDACITAVANNEASAGDVVYVAELSSYQLASTRDFAPDVACVLNITPDHLAWHGTHEAYAAAKWKVLANMSGVPGATAVLNATDDEVRAQVRRYRRMDAAERGFEYIPVGTAQGVHGDMRLACGSRNAAFLDGSTDVLTVAFRGEEHALCRRDDMLLKGVHNTQNALCAAACAVAAGADDAAVAQALADFAPLEHRIQPVGRVRGAACYNDSKATNVDATLAAIKAFDPQRPVILLGGRDKGTDLAPLVDACVAHAKAAVCFGEARERFMAAFEAAARDGFRLLSASRMEEALDRALDVAEPGDIVLLSPACASFDEFSCFEERGQAFAALVAARRAAFGE